MNGMKRMKLVPLHDKIAVVRIKNKAETESGILLTKSVDAVDRAKVVSIGPDVKDVKVNDTLLIDWNKTSMSKFDGIPIYMVSEKDVIGVFE